MEKPLNATRILIVDDEPAHLDYLEELLRVGGYRTEAASNGPEALARARQDPPDLVVLDVGLPEMDGFEVCRQLKADPQTAVVPVIFVTGRHDTRDKEEGILSGAEDYVTKPLDPTDLLTRVRSLLRVSHLSQELDRTLAYLQELEVARRAAPAAPGPAEPLGLPGVMRPGPDVPGWKGRGVAVGAAAAHVVVVDDDRLIRQFYGNLLEGCGYRVTTAASAAQAFEAAARGVDVILLDIMMPGVSGLDALGRLHQIAPDVPVIIVTAFQTAQNAIAALRGGAFDFIVKGMKPEVLLNGVARAVERRHLTLENRRLVERLQARAAASPQPSGAAAT